MLYIVQKDDDRASIYLVKARSQEEIMVRYSFSPDETTVWALSDTDIACLQTNNQMLIAL